MSVRQDRDSEIRYIRACRDMMRVRADEGPPMSEALARVPVTPVPQAEPFEFRVGPTWHGTREVHLVVPEECHEIVNPLAALGDTSIAVEDLGRMQHCLVRECRARGRSWADIAIALGMSRQAATAHFAADAEHERHN